MGDWASKSPIDVSIDFVRQFAELLVTKLLPLRAVDLEKWADDPEEWMNEEEADRWEYELRVSTQIRIQCSRADASLQPCAEQVLQSLLSHYKAELGPVMASLLQQVSGEQFTPSMRRSRAHHFAIAAPQSMEGLLLKEGVYCAFGRSPGDLEGAIDFDSWLEQTLIVEATGTDSKCAFSLFVCASSLITSTAATESSAAGSPG